ncbi:nitroreductase [Denitratisoma oestradiolicum]|uniref:Nitroreductase family protein n=1 Tax=Denitratisoma oestradiolicum TaxID=311182 RepID=A0A6S6XZA1_9PROT|nr:nitroreductase [Denitratisoma oestradiolicum]TWO79220.1 hypothetical protein CBW56_15630 [Denitratisoma oestradiolicum]CAB1368222.1 Nitroreductase family protein [Denitratisoma oestradiolicum]
MMNVTEAVLSRASARAYLDKPVDSTLLRSILATALRAPSGGNVQPWHIHVLLGEAKQNFTQRIMTSFAETPMGESPNPGMYPEPLPDPFKERRAVCGLMLYDALAIPKEDKKGRIAQALKNYEFFGAPVGLIFTMPSYMVEAQAIDMGILMQTIMLLARDHGLDTCPQVIWRMWPQTIRSALNIDDSHHVMGGMCLGYADTASPVANLGIPRAAFEDAVSFHDA